ncbi:hypothetical protein FAK_04520 [Desulfoferula mesophila]|uniref:Uncharacterized protein n=1 Tax=Desulfoferula mesophila TaxID=3058419 RepID=A0AAU9ERZ5_9BACT|nr:hypothetical protein FAK_04520 [Desulfoferula mesophilus]
MANSSPKSKHAAIIRLNGVPPALPVGSQEHAKASPSGFYLQTLCNSEGWFLGAEETWSNDTERPGQVTVSPTILAPYAWGVERRPQRSMAPPGEAGGKVRIQAEVKKRPPRAKREAAPGKG